MRLDLLTGKLEDCILMSLARGLWSFLLGSAVVWGRKQEWGRSSWTFLIPSHFMCNTKCYGGDTLHIPQDKQRAIFIHFGFLQSFTILYFYIESKVKCNSFAICHTSVFFFVPNANLSNTSAIIRTSYTTFWTQIQLPWSSYDYNCHNAFILYSMYVNP